MTTPITPATPTTHAARHYHVSSHSPGYLPDADEPTTVPDIWWALACLADDLGQVLEHDIADAYEDMHHPTTSGGQRLIAETNRLSRVLYHLRAVEALRANGTQIVDLTIADEHYTVEELMAHGLSFDVATDPLSDTHTGRIFEVIPCDEPACAPDPDE